MTNPVERDIRIRKPVFIVSKEFGNGITVKPGIMTNHGIRPYSLNGVPSGIPLTKANFTEIGLNAGVEKETAILCITRLLQDLVQKVQEVSFLL